MKEMVFDFKKSNTPWILEDNEWHTKEQQIKSSIDRIINDVNDPKKAPTVYADDYKRFEDTVEIKMGLKEKIKRFFNGLRKQI